MSRPSPARVRASAGPSPGSCAEGPDQVSAEQAAAACAPLPDGEASPAYLRHLITVHVRQVLGEAFATAAA